ncbi:MAG: 4Fe-4S dicluster domain-containing protein [Candidatus Bathyarchaeia archaeon]
MKIKKKQDTETLYIDRIHHAKKYQIKLDKNLCVGCEICSLICPREAIKTLPTPRKEGEKAKHPQIDIDEQKCSFCGICATICPFGAIQVEWDNKPFITVVEKESFPELIREIKVNTEKCKIGCIDCEEACPLKLIKVTIKTLNGEIVTPEKIDQWKNKEQLKVDVAIKREHCPTCRICELKCPEDAIKIIKTFYGTLKINQEKCPEGCQDCLDVCPIKGALYLSEKDKKVNVNETFCVYCGVCKLVCPVEGALELNRTVIKHTPIRSGAWNKALEKLTSTKEMTKELHAKATLKSKDAVSRRLEWRKT